MKKLLLSFTFLLVTLLNAWSQNSPNKVAVKVNDTSFPQHHLEKNFTSKAQSVNSNGLSKMVPLLPSISFDEFPVNHNMHITTDGLFYYTINGGSASLGQINKFDLAGVLIQTYPIQIDGRGLSYNKADGFLYASLYARDIVRINNLSAGTFTTVFAGGMQNDQASFAISPDGTKYYDFYAGTLLVHNFFTGAVINTITGLSFGPGNFGGEEAVAVDSLYIFTWDASIKTVSKYDLTGSLMQTLVLDSGENGHSISRAGNYLFVAHDGNYAMGRWYGYLVDSTNSLSFVNTCVGDSTSFSISSSINLLGTQWNFGDTASGANNVSYLINPAHAFMQAGTYTVQVIKYFTNYTDTSTLSVTINDSPLVNLGADTSFCAGTIFQLNAGAGYSSYLWQDGSTDSTNTAAVAGTFFVTVFNGNCAATDSIVLTVNTCNAPSINFNSSDTSFCDKHCISFTDLSTNNPISWQWYFPGSDSLASNEQNPTGICYNTYGSFDVTLIACNTNGCDTLFLPGFINEYPLPTPTITQSNDTLFASANNAYQWWNSLTGIIAGAINNFYVPTVAGDYFVVVDDSIGCTGYSNSISVTNTAIYQFTSGDGFVLIHPNPNNGNFSFSLNQLDGKDFTFRIINTVGQTIQSAGIQKSIKGYSSNVKIGAVAKGIYTIEVTIGDKIYRDRFIVN